MEYIIFFCILFFVWLLIKYIRYINTEYYNSTHKSFFSSRFNRGNYGEYLTYICLRCFEKRGAKFLFNCYLPKDNNETTEIDVMMIYKSGIYVFESKNYSGWIYGSENGKTWTQTIQNQRKTIKNSFLNPIMQNNLHIKYLKKQIDENVLVHSIIVFSERCKLKNIEVKTKDIYVINRYDVKRLVKCIDRNINILSINEINNIYNRLYPNTQTSEMDKQKHINDIKQNHEYKYNVNQPINIINDINNSNTRIENTENNINSNIGTNKADNLFNSLNYENSSDEIDNSIKQSYEQQINNNDLKMKKVPQENINTNIQSNDIPSKLMENETQVCPKCNSKLIYKVANKGSHKGDMFLGCTNFPKCRYIREL